HLNPALPMHPAQLPPLIATVGLFYFVHLTVIFYILLVLRQLLAREVFSPAWLSVGVLVWLGAFAAAAGAALTWANLATFGGVLDRATVTVTTDGAIVLSGAAVAFALLGQARRWIGAQARAVWAPLFVVIAVVSV